MPDGPPPLEHLDAVGGSPPFLFAAPQLFGNQEPFRIRDTAGWARSGERRLRALQIRTRSVHGCPSLERRRANTHSVAGREAAGFPPGGPASASTLRAGPPTGA